MINETLYLFNKLISLRLNPNYLTYYEFKHRVIKMKKQAKEEVKGEVKEEELGQELTELKNKHNPEINTK
jgi:hypothetical protein